MLAMLAMLAAVCLGAVRVGVSGCFCLSPGAQEYRLGRRFALGDAVMCFGKCDLDAFFLLSQTLSEAQLTHQYPQRLARHGRLAILSR
jgi:hypothetical protein